MSALADLRGIPVYLFVRDLLRESLANLRYFHGNADQIGWGSAYLGCQLLQTGLGFYGALSPCACNANRVLSPCQLGLRHFESF